MSVGREEAGWFPPEYTNKIAIVIDVVSETRGLTRSPIPKSRKYSRKKSGEVRLPDVVTIIMTATVKIKLSNT
jgi:hypothetical protein